MRLMISCLYATSPQGRIGAINTLCYNDVRHILGAGHTLSTNFKTFKQFTYQPVIFSEMAKELLGIYLKHFRPVAVRNAGLDKEFALVQSNAMLWLMFT